MKPDLEKQFADFVIMALASYENVLGVEATKKLRARYGEDIMHAAFDYFEKFVVEMAEENERVES